ncbi:hypothetical protein DICVIV_00147 [Dictyocaulus viviparus]|uniref:Uncharacterized protein n=1 Tax=Dictyocaulus viviparus TaxID=29172 RepID=A0A0D8YA83_DICVI|nr:hypothetical protein DICVIV_00147 [Dictyocaulus viviparus]
MFTIDGVLNYPCNGIEATTSYECITFSAITLCSTTFTSMKNYLVENVHHVEESRSKTIANRLIQLCDLFDEEYFQPSSSKSSSIMLLIWRFFF